MQATRTHISEQQEEIRKEIRRNAFGSISVAAEQKTRAGSWRPGEGKTRYPPAREGEVILGANDTDPIAPKIGRGCPLFGQNLLFKICDTRNNAGRRMALPAFDAARAEKATDAVAWV
jgi:hypothetical protein